MEEALEVSPAQGAPLSQLSSEHLNQHHQQRVFPIPLQRLETDVITNENVRPQSQQHDSQRSDLSPVKSKVAFLNGLSMAPHRQSISPSKPPSPVKSSTVSSLSSSAAMQRAILGREEAESALVSVHTQLEQTRTRERVVSERVETLMDQLQESRGRQRHERQIYEKEIKQSKRNEYKAELAVIKLQEELREAKSECEQYRARVEHDRAEKEKARQEAFERAYALAGLTEEMESLREKLKVAEREAESVKENAIAAAVAATSGVSGLEEEKEVQAEKERTTGVEIGVQTDAMDVDVKSNVTDAGVQTVKKKVETDSRPTVVRNTTQMLFVESSNVVQQPPQKRTHTDATFEPGSKMLSQLGSWPVARPLLARPQPTIQVPTREELVASIDDDPTYNSDPIVVLQERLAWVQSQLQREQDLVHFMHMQCQFKACPCRLAEADGFRFVHDHEYDQKKRAREDRMGIKRKAEDDLPLRTFKSFRRTLAERSAVELARKEMEDSQTEHIPVSKQTARTERENPRTGPLGDTEATRPLKGGETDCPLRSRTESHDLETTEDEMRVEEPNDHASLAALVEQPPVDVPFQDCIRDVQEDAADIPLPSPRSDDLEPTAVLEEITQVMIETEPATVTKPFAFSTSVSSTRGGHLTSTVQRPTPSESRQWQSQSQPESDYNDDLFDLAPPHSQFVPARPSTAIGIISTRSGMGSQSPIRLVDESSATSSPSSTPYQPRTLQIPLRDADVNSNGTADEASPVSSPSKSHLVRSRSQTRSRSQGRALPPSSSTLRPVSAGLPATPMSRHQNGNALRHERAQTVHRVAHPARPPTLLATPAHPAAPPAATKTTTTTTMIPLRGFEAEEDDVSSPARSEHTNSRTPSHAYPHEQERHYDHDEDVTRSEPLRSSQNSHYKGRHASRSGTERDRDGDRGREVAMIPGTPITREAALAQIRARRDRARSVSSRKLNLSSANPSTNAGANFDKSEDDGGDGDGDGDEGGTANTLDHDGGSSSNAVNAVNTVNAGNITTGGMGGRKTPKSAAKRGMGGIIFDRNRDREREGREMREVSYASAPGRI